MITRFSRALPEKEYSILYVLKINTYSLNLLIVVFRLLSSCSSTFLMLKILLANWFWIWSSLKDVFAFSIYVMISF